MTNFTTVKALVRGILQNASAYEWSLQGFGMLRLSMAFPEGDFRLNIWDSRYRVADVSLMHTHPWDFESLIVVGALCNLRFGSVDEKAEGCESFNFAAIKPGPGGGLTEGPTGLVKLVCCAREYYRASEAYEQKAEEIHLSLPEDGTVTLNLRERRSEDIARVFWRVGKTWVSAEPKKASAAAVTDIVSNALRIF